MVDLNAFAVLRIAAGTSQSTAVGSLLYMQKRAQHPNPIEALSNVEHIPVQPFDVFVGWPLQALGGVVVMERQRPQAAEQRPNQTRSRALQTL